MDILMDVHLIMSQDEHDDYNNDGDDPKYKQCGRRIKFPVTVNTETRQIDS